MRALNDSATIRALVEGARRRMLGNLVMEQTAVGLAAAFAGAVALLLVGSQILDWYWPVVLFAAGAGITAWRTLRQLPGAYQVAQSIDARLSLNDTLSTALYFLGADARGSSGAIIATQRAEAERTAAEVHLPTAVPWRLPPHAVLAVGMFAAAATLFVVRYSIHGKLDLRQPIVEAVADFFRPGEPVVARAKKQPGEMAGEQPLTVPLDAADTKKPELDSAPEDALTVTDTPDVNAGVDPYAEERTRRSEMKAGTEPGDAMSEEEGEKGADSGRDSGSEGKADSQAGDQPGQKAAAKNQNQSGDPENSSLMDKMRDAMASLLNKMNMQQQGSQSTQRASNSKGGREGKKEGGAQQGQKGAGDKQGKGTPNSEADAEAGQEGAQQAQASPGKSMDKGAEQGAPNEAKSGMGKQDGSKDLKDAEQLAAMGKISEIFGKRAQNVTGEVMIEVSSSKQQQLRTQYSQRGAAHREAGGEIHRDEVPQEFQHYVQQYFEKVRKAEQARESQGAAPGR